MLVCEELDQGTGKAFLYTRYDAGLSDAGLEAVWPGAQRASALRLNRVASMKLFDRIGAVYAQQVALCERIEEILKG